MASLARLPLTPGQCKTSLASTEPGTCCGRFALRGICMVPAALSLIPCFMQILWRFVFTGMRRGWQVREIDAPRRRQNGLLGQGLHVLDPAGLTLVEDELENRVGGAGPVDRKYRAQSYLRRIVALSGATHMGSGYALDIGTTRFQVRYRYVTRVRDVTDPKCAYEETCFYPAQKEMPKAEQIATALLQLTNNPALFDKWAVQGGLAFKAGGQVFTRAR